MIPDASFTARGAGGHYCLVIPDYDLVIVHRVNTFQRDRSVTSREFGELVVILALCDTALYTGRYYFPVWKWKTVAGQRAVHPD